MREGYVSLTSPETQAVDEPGPPPEYNAVVSVNIPESPDSVSTMSSYDDPSFSPPTYQVAAALPTYEEAELAKAGKLAGNYGRIPKRPDPESLSSRPQMQNGVEASELYFFGFTTEDYDANQDEVIASDTVLLGNDFVFFTAFLAAFLFNWIGLLLIVCFCRTIASRFGALSGFGLSLAKWTLIVKGSTDIVSPNNSWIWWLVMAFGMIICMRSICQYLFVKKTWRILTPAARQRIFINYK